ncbi:MDR family MFS transporter [Ktedonospora formicarum]|uniref:MFS transporter n=1 Tax=Ktedonospora formicarum TaxID=2778364 RepID=A0A8J3I7B7_9CHLR|nr:MFS transporter [Ktedonospora formicarum]GHO49971.1 MFS transporter [Ktedonospora formicarum]
MQSPLNRCINYFKNLQFSRPFWFLVAGSFINRAGNFVMPFFALYLTSARHFSISEATLVVSLMGLGSLAAGVCGGMMADTLGRRMTMLISLFASAGLMLALSFATNLPLIIAFAIFYELFSDLARPATSAAIADMTPREKLTQAYSLRYWANNIGSAVGPVIAGLLAPISYFLLFLGDAVTTLCFSIMIWFGLPETRLPRKAKVGDDPEEPERLRHALSDLWLWGYALLGLLFDAVYFQHATAMPLDMQAHGLNPLAYGTVMALNAVLVVVVSLPLTAFFNRRSPNTSIAVAALCLGLGMSVFSWWHSYLGYLIGVLIWTLGEILFYPVSNALIAEIAPKHLRGTYQGIYQTVRATALVIGPVLGGYALQHLGSVIFWQCCFAIGLFVAVGYFIMGFARRTHKAHLALSAQPLLPVEGPLEEVSGGRMD